MAEVAPFQGQDGMLNEIPPQPMAIPEMVRQEAEDPQDFQTSPLFFNCSSDSVTPRPDFDNISLRDNSFHL